MKSNQVDPLYRIMLDKLISDISGSVESRSGGTDESRSGGSAMLIIKRSAGHRRIRSFQQGTAGLVRHGRAGHFGLRSVEEEVLEEQRKRVLKELRKRVLK